AQRELRAFDDEWYVTRPRPLRLGAVQELPVPGRLELGDAELELHPAAGHTVDGMAIWAPAAGVLVCGDLVSPVEIPWLSAGGSGGRGSCGGARSGSRAARSRSTCCSARIRSCRRAATSRSSPTTTRRRSPASTTWTTAPSTGARRGASPATPPATSSRSWP